MSEKQREERPEGWTYLSNHSHVLICLVHNSQTRIRDIAAQVQITERAVQRILHDLESAGVISKEKFGRRNSYTINMDSHLRHPLESHSQVRDLLSFAVQEGL
jgi:predicted transcriptional regulator